MTMPAIAPPLRPEEGVGEGVGVLEGAPGAVAQSVMFQ